MGNLDFGKIRRHMLVMNGKGRLLLKTEIKGSWKLGYTFIWHWYEASDCSAIHSTMTQMTGPELRRSVDPMADTLRKIDFVSSRKEVEGMALVS